MRGAELGLTVYFAAYAAMPLFAWGAFAAPRSAGVRRAAFGLLALVSGLLVYARFVEPHLLLAPEHEIELKRCFQRAGQVRLALLSDLNIGRFANSPSVSRIADKLNEIAPDAALIAGDFVDHLDQAKFEVAFAPLAGVRAPVYSVYGNHDVGLAEPDIRDWLEPALVKAGVRTIDGRSARLETSRGAIEVAGFTDFRRGPPLRAHLEAETDLPRVLLTHYPGWADWLKGVRFDLMAAGHTHGGQINLPFVTCRFIRRACEMTRYGLVDVNGRPLFVTSGTGLVQLPLRFRAAPRIDVLNIRFEACG